MKHALIKAIDETLARDPNVFFLTADLGYMAFEDLLARYPRRFLNVGVAEANMIGVAGGLARAGKTVFCYSMIPFVTMRCLEQTRIHLGIGKLNVKLIGVGAGFTYGVQGSTHHAIEDIGMMRAIPNMTVLHPGDAVETWSCVTAAATLPGPVYIRLGWPTHTFEREALGPLPVGQLLKIREGRAGAGLVIATGSVLGDCHKAIHALGPTANDWSLYSAPTIKPFDEPAFLALATRHQRLVVVESNVAQGGFGEYLGAVLARSGTRLPFATMAIPDEYFRVAGSKEQLEDLAQISAAAVAGRLRELHGAAN